MIKNNNYYISEINSSKAFKFISLYHYSHVGYKKSILNLGVFRNSDNKLVGVLQWGCSFQEKIKLNRYVTESIDKKEYLELNRFSMADSEGENAESQAISLGIKWIKKNRPDIRLLVSYAGRKEGNYGYIYQATNWEYLGYFISHGFWWIDGHEKHLNTLWCNYRNSKSDIGFYNWLDSKYQDIRETWTKQFIYIQRLDKTLTPASEILPYPKESTDAPIKVNEKIVKQNDEIYNNPIPIEVPFVEYYYEKDKYLFSKVTLKRRGIEVDVKTKYIIARYDNNGQLEKIYKDYNEIESTYIQGSVRRVISTGKIYKEKYFRIYLSEEDVPLEIDVPFVCIIDDIYFARYAEAARYLGVSRQCVQQSSKRHGKINGKEIIWNDIDK